MEESDQPCVIPFIQSFLLLYYLSLPNIVVGFVCDVCVCVCVRVCICVCERV